MHWLPAPARATIVDVVDGGLTTVLVVVVEAVVAVPIDVLGDEVRAGVVEQLVRRTTRANAVTKPTRAASRAEVIPALQAKLGPAVPSLHRHRAEGFGVIR